MATDLTWYHLQKTVCLDGYCTVHALPREPRANGNRAN